MKAEVDCERREIATSLWTNINLAHLLSYHSDGRPVFLTEDKRSMVMSTSRNSKPGRVVYGSKIDERAKGECLRQARHCSALVLHSHDSN